MGDFGVVCLGTDGVELAIEFLAEKVEGTANRLGCGEELGEFLEVSGESGDFFGDVAAVAEEGDLLEDALVGGIDFEVSIGESLHEEFALSDGNGGCDGGDLFGEALQDGEPGGEVGFEGLSLFSSSNSECFEGFGECWLDGGEDFFDVVTVIDQELVRHSQEVLSSELEGLS